MTLRFHLQVPDRTYGDSGESVDDECNGSVEAISHDEKVANIFEPRRDEEDAAVEKDKGDAGQRVADGIEELTDIGGLAGNTEKLA